MKHDFLKRNRSWTKRFINSNFFVDQLKIFLAFYLAKLKVKRDEQKIHFGHANAMSMHLQTCKCQTRKWHMSKGVMRLLEEVYTLILHS